MVQPLQLRSRVAEQIAREPVALLINVCANVMLDLPSAVTHAGARIERHRTDPQWEITRIAFIGLPEPDVMASARVTADQLFKGQVLFAAPQIKITDWRVVVAPMRHAVARNAQRRHQRDWIGRLPA